MKAQKPKVPVFIPILIVILCVSFFAVISAKREHVIRAYETNVQAVLKQTAATLSVGIDSSILTACHTKTYDQQTAIKMLICKCKRSHVGRKIVRTKTEWTDGILTSATLWWSDQPSNQRLLKYCIVTQNGHIPFVNMIDVRSKLARMYYSDQYSIQFVRLIFDNSSCTIMNAEALDRYYKLWWHANEPQPIAMEIFYYDGE